MSFELLLTTRELGSTRFAKILELHSRTYGYSGNNCFRGLRYKTIALPFMYQLDERECIRIPHPADSLIVKRPETIPFLAFENSTAKKCPEKEMAFNQRIERYFRKEGLGNYLLLPRSVSRKPTYAASDICDLISAFKQRPCVNTNNF